MMLTTASRVPSVRSATRCASTSPDVLKPLAVQPLGSSGRASQRRNGACTSISCRRDSARSSVSLLRVRHNHTFMHHGTGAARTHIANTTPLNRNASSVNTTSTTTAQMPS